MNTGPTENLPVADKEFLDSIVEVAKAIYAATGGMEHSLIMQTGKGILGEENDKLVLAMPQLGGSQEDKMACIQIIAHHSLRLASPRSAIIAECWTIDHDKGLPEEDLTREIAQLKMAGKSFADHPNAKEVIMVSIESDLGRTNATLSIDRAHKDMVLIEVDRDPVFLPAHVQTAVYSLMSGFHVPSPYRIDPEVIEWAKEMDEIYGDPRDKGYETQDHDQKAETLRPH